MSKSNEYFFKRKVLLHQTDLPTAEIIIGTQQMIPGSKGMYGPGVYFGNSTTSCDLKALRKGVFLVAEVTPHKTKAISKEEANSLDMYHNLSHSQQLKDQGFTAVCGYHQPTGREFVIYDPSLIKNIKFAYGTSCPTTPFPLQYGKDLSVAVLFWVTDHRTANQIVDSQKITLYDGPFGKAFYLFDSINDAIQVLGNQETFLAADMDVRSLCHLRPHQKIYHKNIPRHFTSFLGIKDGINYYMVKNPKRITSIHFCGGVPWNIE